MSEVDGMDVLRRWTITRQPSATPSTSMYHLIEGPETGPVRVVPETDYDALAEQLRGAVDALDFALRTVSDPDLTEAEIRDRIGRVVGKTLGHPGGQ